MPDLKRINDAIIKKSFPELIDEDIKVCYRKVKNYVAICNIERDNYRIEVSIEMEGSPVKVLTGICAHEDCHIVKDKLFNSYQSKKDRKLYRSKIFKTLQERDTDLQVILRGYGQELLAFKKYTEKMGFQFYKEDGLSIGEVQKLLYIRF